MTVLGRMERKVQRRDQRQNQLGAMAMLDLKRNEDLNINGGDGTHLLQGMRRV